MAVVAVDRLRKRYDRSDEFAVRDVSFSVSDGEFMVLLGPSGCGKSSVLRMIAGLEAITTGTVSLDHQVMNHVPAKDRDIAMVFQSYALYPHMTVYDNMAFGLRRRGVSRHDTERRVSAVAEKLGLSPFLKRRPHALSGGQRQRVALGRAIVRDPKVFLFDEPLSNLDASLRVSMRNELIRQQHELGTTAIYVTHDQIEAMTMGDRICIMNKGEVVQIGRPLDVYRAPADTFVARFLGSPPMNLFSSGLAAAGGDVRLRLAGTALPLPRWPAAPAGLVQGEVIAGIRPEDIYEAAPPEVAVRAAPLPARVIAVEPLGSETLVVLGVGDPEQEMIARVGRVTAWRSGDAVTVAIDTAAIHLFDPATTRAISPAG